MSSGKDARRASTVSLAPSKVESGEIKVSKGLTGLACSDKKLDISSTVIDSENAFSEILEIA